MLLLFPPSPALLSIRITDDYETFKDTALKVPEDSREIMDLIEYMNEAQSKLVVDLRNDVQVKGIVLEEERAYTLYIYIVHV